MKDRIVEEIHRHRAAYAKRFHYDVHAIGEDIRRSESESGGKFVPLNPRRKLAAKTTRGRRLVAHK